MASRKGLLIQSQLAVAPFVGPDDQWSQQGQQPGYIRGTEKMQRTSISPGADNRTVGNGFFYIFPFALSKTDPQRPFCPFVVLSLDASKPGDNPVALLVSRFLRKLGSHTPVYNTGSREIHGQ